MCTCANVTTRCCTLPRLSTTRLCHRNAGWLPTWRACMPTRMTTRSRLPTQMFPRWRCSPCPHRPGLKRRRQPSRHCTIIIAGMRFKGRIGGRRHHRRRIHRRASVGHCRRVHRAAMPPSCNVPGQRTNRLTWCAQARPTEPSVQAASPNGADRRRIVTHRLLCAAMSGVQALARLLCGLIECLLRVPSR